MPNARTFALAAALAGAMLAGACKKDEPEKLPVVHHTAKPGAVQQGNSATKAPDSARAAAGKTAGKTAGAKPAASKTATGKTTTTAATAGKTVAGKVATTQAGAKQQPGGIAPSKVPASKVPVSTPPVSKVPASKVPVSTPPANAGVAAKGAATAPTGATKGAPAATTAPATVATRDTAKGVKGQVRPTADSAASQPIMRETFSYDASGRRDPFTSLMSTSELRPAISDLRLTGILYDPSGRRPIAIMRDLQTKAQYRVTTGMTLGRMRVAQIKPHAVIFSIEEFGMNRQDSLVLGDSSKVRIP